MYLYMINLTSIEKEQSQIFTHTVQSLKKLSHHLIHF